MASSIVLKLACLVLVCMMASAPLVKADVSCGQVVNNLLPCLNYVENGGAVPANCCNGVKTLYQAAQTTVDRQSVCRCLKSAVSGVPYTGFNLGLAAVDFLANVGSTFPTRSAPLPTAAA